MILWSTMRPSWAAPWRLPCSSASPLANARGRRCGAVSLERLAQDANGDLVYTFTHPWSDGTTGIRLSPVALLEKLAALVPLPRVHLVRYGGCLAPHSSLRGAIMPTPRQQGVEEDDATPESPHWSWARLLKRVFALDMAT